MPLAFSMHSCRAQYSLRLSSLQGASNIRICVMRSSLRQGHVRVLKLQIVSGENGYGRSALRSHLPSASLFLLFELVNIYIYI